MNIESIGEVKVLAQGYQAEYGRSSGLQITTYTKSGTNELHGSGYGLFTRWNWNKNSWANLENNVPQAKTYSSIYGYSVGGPVYIPKVINGKNKLFFFYAHEFRPATIAINGGDVIQVRMPTALERAGNFSQSLNNQGVAINPIINYSNGAPFPGNIIPANMLYAPGQAVLNQYPLPNVAQGPGMNYNWQINAPTYQQLTQQPAVKLDYQATQKLRFSAKYDGQIARSVTTPGYIPGFNDAYVPYPWIANEAATVTYVISPTTFIEGTYGRIENQLAGGNESGIPTDASSNRLTALPTFPELYPNAGVMNTGYYGYQVMQATKPPFWDGKSLNLNPTFGWGSFISTNVCSVVVEEVPWGDGKRTLTKAYMLFLARWARRLSWKETAEAFRTSWEKVFDAVEHVAIFGLEHRVFGQIDAIGVDEFTGGRQPMATPQWRRPH